MKKASEREKKKNINLYIIINDRREKIVKIISRSLQVNLEQVDISIYIKIVEKQLNFCDIVSIVWFLTFFTVWQSFCCNSFSEKKKKYIYIDPLIIIIFNLLKSCFWKGIEVGQVKILKYLSSFEVNFESKFFRNFPEEKILIICYLGRIFNWILIKIWNFHWNHHLNNNLNIN
ncbi:hypothetical protein RFI_00840 [Reticulomyxa filosa]|uniref:Uncharacterized protein n=1 Tax=Reticulomyxa filosa TaxID=46433 RepID=X6PDD7_RETFI|nr:hypothetical protein RFI_00840 [Reticulomyxa filosa]|eukprot:ETO36221.1 hypothetical protein RFI_00840 [Reticulomyxa filosa]